jgi:hypothetical protein
MLIENLEFKNLKTPDEGFDGGAATIHVRTFSNEWWI